MAFVRDGCKRPLIIPKYSPINDPRLVKSFMRTAEITRDYCSEQYFDASVLKKIERDFRDVSKQRKMPAEACRWLSKRFQHYEYLFIEPVY